MLRTLSRRIHSVQASVPYAHCQHVLNALFKFGIFTLVLSIRVSSWRARVSSWRTWSACWTPFWNLEFLHLCWAYAWGTDAYAQGKHQFLMCMLRNAPVPGPYAQGKQQSLMHMLSKFGRYALLKIRLNIRGRNFAAPTEPPKYFLFYFVF